MNKGILILLIGSFLGSAVSAQNDPVVHADTTFVMEARTELAMEVSENEAPEVYKLKPKIDIPLTLIAGGWSGYAFTKIYSKDPSTTQQILALRKEDINGFDRWAADVYHDKAAHSSDFFFYGAMPLPLTLMLDKEIRQDAGKIGFLYLEAMSITGLIYTGSVYMVDRYRPLSYHAEVPMEDKIRGGSKNSFIAGHPALVATSTFFTAKVFSHYNPNSKLRPYLYGAAIICTGGTAWLRHRGGKHFPSDLIIGTTIGTLSGLLVPNLHRNKEVSDKISIVPYMGKHSSGMHLTYKL